MENLNICSNEKLSFKYNDDWKLDEIPDNSNPDCIATLTYKDGSYFNVIAYQTEWTSLEMFKEVVENSLINDGANIISSMISKINGMNSLQIHSHISIPEISFDMFSVIFIEDGFLFFFELRTVSDLIGEFMKILETLEIKHDLE
ncbi:MAG: hypothetical protein U0L35_08945 [Methanobrevibacter sp.]|jgi:hypothetical protein|nr:hypothetical protein [Methanobrevibacter sp.]